MLSPPPRLIVEQPHLSSAQSLLNVCVCIALPFVGEQTWLTEEELAAAAAAAGAQMMRKRRLPPGTSEYQAAWILDDDDGSDLEGSDDSEGTHIETASEVARLSCS